MRAFSVVVFAVLVGVVVVFGCHRDAGDPAEFRSALTCGLKQAEVARLAERFGATNIGCPPPPSLSGTSCFVEFGRIGFDLEFDDGGLGVVIPSRAYGLMGVEVEPKEYLCRGGRPMLFLDANERRADLERVEPSAALL